MPSGSQEGGDRVTQPVRSTGNTGRDKIAGIVSNSISSGVLHVATWNGVSKEKKQ